MFDAELIQDSLTEALTSARYLDQEVSDIVGEFYGGEWGEFGEAMEHLDQFVLKLERIRDKVANQVRGGDPPQEVEYE